MRLNRWLNLPILKNNISYNYLYINVVGHYIKVVVISLPATIAKYPDKSSAKTDYIFRNILYHKNILLNVKICIKQIAFDLISSL